MGETEMDYRSYYHMEDYLFDAVRLRFQHDGRLNAFDFFCIIIWKANRAKTKIAQRLMKQGYPSLEDAVKTLTTELYRQTTDKDRLRILVDGWGFKLPMASAILTVLYPESFTVYDVRVCDSLGDCYKLSNVTSFEHLWRGYLDFKEKVTCAVADEMTLRDKDRYLWGRSFYDQLTDDVARAFEKA